MFRTYVATPPRVFVQVDTQSARGSPMSYHYGLEDFAARGRLRPLVAIGPADRDSGQQEDREHWKVDQSEVDGEPGADEGGDRHDRSDRQRLATQIVVRQSPVSSPQPADDQRQHADIERETDH